MWKIKSGIKWKCCFIVMVSECISDVWGEMNQIIKI